MTELTLSVPDISCGHCKSSIEGAVGALAGITGVEVDIEGRTVDVTFEDGSVDLPTIVDAIEGQGYTVADR
ncbi:MAG: heavy-metal-associated domain-containing protein [Acidimicrobiia bacterium]|nr:heavy-metal-associated domain-containing protein [Acidimicrobiia bacterium]